MLLVRLSPLLNGSCVRGRVRPTSLQDGKQYAFASLCTLLVSKAGETRAPSFLLRSFEASGRAHPPSASPPSSAAASASCVRPMRWHRD